MFTHVKLQQGIWRRSEEKEIMFTLAHAFMQIQRSTQQCITLQAVAQCWVNFSLQKISYSWTRLARDSLVMSTRESSLLMWVCVCVCVCVCVALCRLKDSLFFLFSIANFASLCQTKVPLGIDTVLLDWLTFFLSKIPVANTVICFVCVPDTCK